MLVPTAKAPYPPVEMTEQPSQQLDLQAVTKALRRRWRLIALVTVLSAGVALGVSLVLPDKYEASADLLFREADPPPNIDPTEPLPDRSQAPERIAATNLALASLDKVATRVETKLDTDMTAKELRESVELEPQGQADIVTITATGGTAEEAARIANAFADEVVALRREAAQEQIQRVIDTINARLAAAPESDELTARLSQRGEELELEKQIETGEVQIAEEAVPPREKSSPKPLRNTAIGFLLGLIVGSLLAVLLQRFDRRVDSEAEVGAIFGAPVIARVPVERATGWERELFAEAFQFLRANLQLRDVEGKFRSIAVTSALPGNGKSTVAARLAEALALSGAEVVVVDSDLRRPTLHEYYGVSAHEGLTSALVGLRDPAAMLRPTDVPAVRLLPAGPLMALPASVLAGTKGMTNVLTRLKEVADYVVVDTSPVTIGADASAIASCVDGTLVVVDVESVRRDVLTAASEQLHAARANMIGVVINRAEVLLKDEAYRGYYGRSGQAIYADEPPPPQEPPADAYTGPAVAPEPPDYAELEEEMRLRREARERASGSQH
jgi:polysaccharide biosynthesis transport protein